MSVHDLYDYDLTAELLCPHLNLPGILHVGRDLYRGYS